MTEEAFDTTDLTRRFQVSVRPSLATRDGSATEITAVPSRFSRIWTLTGALAVTAPAVPASQKLIPVKPREGTRTACCCGVLATTSSQCVSSARAAVRSALAPGIRMYA